MEESVALEQEIAEVLINLRRLIGDADRGTSGIHGLRWGARRRRSAGSGDIRLSLPLPEHHSRKRRRRDLPQARDYRPPALTPETSSPETPLDFCPSAEEADAKAKIRSASAIAPRLEKPRMKHGEFLCNQVEALNRARSELEKEAAEVKNRLDSLKKRNSTLKELRLKMENEKNQQRQRSPEQDASTSDPLQIAPILPVEDDSQAQTPLLPQQIFNQPWPRHWLNNHVVLHRTPGPQWSWMSSQIWKSGNLLDLNSAADKESGEEFSHQPHPRNLHHHSHLLNHHHRPQQEHEQRRGSPEEQRAARKKRVEMMHTRRRIAAMR